VNQFFAFNKPIRFLGARLELAINGNFRPLYAQEERSASFVNEDGPSVGGGGAENFFPARLRNPYRPSSREFAILATLSLALVLSIGVHSKLHKLTRGQRLWPGLKYSLTKSKRIAFFCSVPESREAAHNTN
jgi:hypothetical protein